MRISGSSGPSYPPSGPEEIRDLKNNIKGSFEDKIIDDLNQAPKEDIYKDIKIIDPQTGKPIIIKEKIGEKIKPEYLQPIIKEIQHKLNIGVIKEPIPPKEREALENALKALQKDPPDHNAAINFLKNI